jgi:hypothetical protein
MRQCCHILRESPCSLTWVAELPSEWLLTAVVNWVPFHHTLPSTECVITFSLWQPTWQKMNLNLIFFFFCSTGVWTQGLHLEPLHQPFFVMRFFWHRVSQTICPCWFQTMILLISVSWVARITGVSHWRPDDFYLLITSKVKYLLRFICWLFVVLLLWVIFMCFMFCKWSFFLLISYSKE